MLSTKVRLFIFLLFGSSILLSPTTLHGQTGPAAPPGQGNPHSNGEHVKGKLLVKFHPSKTPEAIKEFLDSFGASRGKKALIPELGIYEVQLPSLPGGVDEHAYRQAFKEDPRDIVELVDVDRIYSPVLTPNDSQYAAQWHLPKISAPSAWDFTTGSSALKIAVLDTGVNGSHPDLAAKMVPGWNTHNNNSDTSDVNGHGTKVAGVIAAMTNNSLGVAGVAWGPMIMPIRIAAPNGGAFGSSIAQGLVWAANNGARIANISFSNLAHAPIIDSAARYFQLKNGIVVGAAGLNWGAPSIDDPYILNVNATDPNDALASFCSIGDFVDISAPGVGILTTDWLSGYIAADGLSLATPVVSGVAALVMSANPALSPLQVAETIKRSAVDLGTAGYDPSYGFGRINAQDAVNLAISGYLSSGDRTMPNVRILAPTTGATVSTLVPIQISADDNVALISVNLIVDDVMIATDTIAPYEFSWATSENHSVPNGSHLVQVEAVDSSWNSASAYVVVNVNNPSTLEPPIINNWCPQPHAVLSGVRELYGDSDRTASLHFTVDGSSSQIAIPYFDIPTAGRFFWNTVPFTNNSHILRTDAIDQWGNSSFKEIPLTVRNIGADVTPPAPPHPSIPNSETLNDNTPTFSWAPVTDVSGIASYRLMVYSLPNTAVPKLEVTLTPTQTAYTPTSPLPNGNYGWRVGVTDGAGNVDYCGSLGGFTINVSDLSFQTIPTLSLPTNGSVVNTRLVTLNWSGVLDPNGGRYKIETDVQSDFSNPGVSDYSYSPSYGPALFLPNTTHYWRVKAIGGMGSEGPWSNIRSFTINTSADTTAPSSAPVLSIPANGSRIKGVHQPFEVYWMIDIDWSDVSDTTGVTYQLQIDNSGSTFPSPERDLSYIFGSGIPSGLDMALEGTYWWRVRAVDGADNPGPWSAVSSFTLDTTAPAPPQLSSPANGSSVANGTPILDWADATDPGGVRYRIEITDVNFTTETYKINLTSSTYTPPANLAPGIHYWRIAADDALGNLGVMGPRRSFRVAGDSTLPEAPTLISPQHGTNTLNSTVTLDWANVIDASGTVYSLQVDNSGSSFSSPEINLANLNASIYTPTSLANGTYFWRVMATDGSGNQGSWSIVRSVTIGPAAAHPADTNKDFSISGSEALAYIAAFKLTNSWPNPPSPITTGYALNCRLLFKLGPSYHVNPNYLCGSPDPSPSSCWIAGP